jgi:hypothetical protein
MDDTMGVLLIAEFFFFNFSMLLLMISFWGGGRVGGWERKKNLQLLNNAFSVSYPISSGAIYLINFLLAKLDRKPTQNCQNKRIGNKCTNGPYLTLGLISK